MLLQITDRMEILQAALDAQPGAYTNHSALISLAAQLGLSKRASELRCRMAAAALREGDLEAAQAGCMALVKEGYAPAWELAAQLAQLNAATADGYGEVKRDMLAFALAHCTPDQVFRACDDVSPLTAILTVRSSLWLFTAIRRRLDEGDGRCIKVSVDSHDFACWAIRSGATGTSACPTQWYFRLGYQTSCAHGDFVLQFDDLARLWHTASWQPSVPARTPKDLILCSLQPAKPSLLPEFGDAPVAFAAVLSSKEDAWSALQQGLEEAEDDYCLTRRLLLLGMFAASFRVCIRKEQRIPEVEL